MNQQRKTIYALRRQILEGRYAPEPTEEDKKKGKTPADTPAPTESGDWTRRDASAEVGRGRVLARMMRRRSTEAPHAPTPNAPTARRAARRRPLRAGASCAHEIYRQFGALARRREGVAEDRDRRARPRWPTRSRASLIQQRERLLDLVRGDAAGDRRRALPAQRARRGLGPRRARATRSRSASTSSRPSTRPSSIEPRRWPSRSGTRSRR